VRAGRAMLHALQTLVAAIDAAFSSVETGAMALDDAPLPSDALDRLEALLRDADYGAVSQFRQVAPALRQRFGPALHDLETRLRSFDYVRALAALRALRDTSPP
jgi:hypothetical protein